MFSFPAWTAPRHAPSPPAVCRDKDLERAQRAAETARAAEASCALRLGEAEDVARRLEAEMAGFRSKLAQADSTLKVGAWVGGWWYVPVCCTACQQL